MKLRSFGYKHLSAAKLAFIVGLGSGIFYSTAAMAQSGFGAIATNLMAQFEALAQLVLAVAFLGGLGFVMAAIFKFKQHKDNPQQIPLGTPIAMLVIGAVLIFLPSLIAPAGFSLYGSSAVQGGTSGSGLGAVTGGS